MSLIPLGLLSWLMIGLAIGITALRMLPGGFRLGGVRAIVIALGGSIFGGVLATVMGFGGLVGYDLRALSVATLSSVLLTLLAVIRALRPGAP